MDNWVFEIMKRVLSWFDNNIVAVLSGFLLVFIPLYPKWPLFDILYGYNVRVRLEDFFVLFSLVIYVLWLLRRKISLQLTPITVGLIGYLIIGFLSVISSLFWAQTVPLQYLHVAKTVLHWMRRIEYFSLFFLFFVSITSLKRIRVYVALFFVVFLAVIIYGYGQKYLYWPAFSTMNREFAKGWWLYLTEHARVLSTFGGHYDLAGYLVIALSLSWSFFFGLRNRLQKLGMGILIAGGFWLLILTASRISFVGYISGLSIVVGIWTFKKGLTWGVSRWLVTIFLSMLIMLSFGDLSDRFLRLLKLTDRVAGLRAVLLTPAKGAPTSNAMFLENNIAAVTSLSDMPPTPARPAEVTGKEEPLFIPQRTASGASILVEKQRSYSANAIMFDLSTGIRLDSTWPMAINGFKKNVLFGSGYATLTKTDKYQYTEAESTDNDYLRALGETGALGFLAFFGVMIAMGVIAYKSLGGIEDNYLYSLTAGFIGLLGGLMINATYIDIFEASKVAYVFWGVSGLTMGMLYLYKDKIKENWQPLKIEFSMANFIARIKKFLVSDFLWVTLLAVLCLSLRFYKLDSPIADWHSWRQADTSAVTRDFYRQHSINWLYPTYDDLSSIASGKANPKGYRFVEFPLYNAATVVVSKIVPEWTIEQSGRATTALIATLGMVFLFLLTKQLVSRRVAFLSAFIFAALPYNIFYGRTVLPDPSMVTLSLGSIWLMARFIATEKKRYFIFGTILSVAALLVKPYAIFLLAPIAYLWVTAFGIEKKKLGVFVLFALLALLPLLLWRLWITQFPEGIPASTWLLNGDGIRLKGAWWYWIFADRVAREIMGFWGIVLIGVGLMRSWLGRFKFFPVLFLLSTLSYLVIFATGNVRHDYYQILIVPALVLLAGMGLDYLLSSGIKGRILAVFCTLLMLGLGWYVVRDLYNINHPELMTAGHAVRENTDWRALVIAPYDGDTAFLYQTDRKGWPIMQGTIDDMVAKGAQYYVSVRFDDLTKKLMSESWQKGVEYPINFHPKYKLIAYTDTYVLIQLVPDNKLPKN